MQLSAHEALHRTACDGVVHCGGGSWPKRGTWEPRDVTPIPPAPRKVLRRVLAPEHARPLGVPASDAHERTHALIEHPHRETTSGSYATARRLRVAAVRGAKPLVMGEVIIPEADVDDGVGGLRQSADGDEQWAE